MECRSVALPGWPERPSVRKTRRRFGAVQRNTRGITTRRDHRGGRRSDSRSSKGAADARSEVVAIRHMRVVDQIPKGCSRRSRSLSAATLFLAPM